MLPRRPVPAADPASKESQAVRRPDAARRALVGAALAAPLWPALAADADAEAALRAGGVVLGMRHALAPGTFDPPQFRLGDCSTQRLLSDEGRAQARRIGEWFKARNLVPARVRSSPWCRCVDTAQLAFGSAETWAALGSPRGADGGTNAAALRELKTSLAAASARPGRFEVWVTHMFVLSDLAGTNTGSGDGLVMRIGRDGPLQVIARLPGT